MEDLGQIIATNLIFLRKNASLTQLEFGEKFNYTDKTVSRWESGTVIPSVETLKQIADFYGVSVDYILTEHKSSKEFQSTVKKTINARNKIILISLFVTVIWIIGMTVYLASIVNLKTSNFNDNRWWSVFLWCVPASFATMAFFTERWFKNPKYGIGFLSAFVWSILLASFITFLYKESYWYLFFIGVPVQIALILIYKLRKGS